MYEEVKTEILIYKGTVALIFTITKNEIVKYGFSVYGGMAGSRLLTKEEAQSDAKRIIDDQARHVEFNN